MNHKDLTPEELAQHLKRADMRVAQRLLTLQGVPRNVPTKEGDSNLLSARLAFYIKSKTSKPKLNKPTPLEAVKAAPDTAIVKFWKEDEYSGLAVGGKSWWSYAKASTHRFAAQLELIAFVGCAVTTLTFPKADAVVFLEWCESLPAWNSGPHYAPRPLLVEIWDCGEKGECL